MVIFWYVLECNIRTKCLARFGEGGEILGAFRKVRTFLGLVTLGGHHHENSDDCNIPLLLHLRGL